MVNANNGLVDWFYACWLRPLFYISFFLILRLLNQCVRPTLRGLAPLSVVAWCKPISRIMCECHGPSPQTWTIGPMCNRHILGFFAGPILPTLPSVKGSKFVSCIMHHPQCLLFWSCCYVNMLRYYFNLGSTTEKKKNRELASLIGSFFLIFARMGA